MQIAEIKKAAKIIFPVALTVLTMTACSNPKTPNKHENDKTIITSCNNISRVSVATLTAQEQTDVCGIMVTAIKRSPPAYLLHDFLRLVALVKETAADESANLIAMQAMDIVQTRQQEGNDLAIQNTFDTLWQIYQDTQTQITFDDLNSALKKSGMAKDVSDSLLEKIGITMWEERNRARAKNAMNASKNAQHLSPKSFFRYNKTQTQ